MRIKNRLREDYYGSIIRERILKGGILPLIGVYDVFSAILAAQKFEAIFCSHYGLPD